MTTTVRILVEGNKAVEICTKNPDGSNTKPPITLFPRSFAVENIHGGQSLSVREVGDFIN